MAPKRTCKLIHETMVEEPTQDREVPPKAIREEEQKDSKVYQKAWVRITNINLEASRHKCRHKMNI